MELRIVKIVSLLLAGLSCGCSKPDAVVPPKDAVPEFTEVRYEAGTLLGKGYADFSAKLSTDNGVIMTGFMLGRDEVDLAFFPAHLQDCAFSVRVDDLDTDTEYCFYAKAGNGRNEIRTRMVRFKTAAEGSSGTVPTEPDNPVDPTPEYPPEGVGITISDPNFQSYLLQLCDADSDGKIVVAEADVVSEISVNTDNISTLDGIQYFRNLRNLECCGTVWNGKLTSLALGGNTALEKLNCNYNLIVSISLPGSLLELECRFNRFSSLNLGSAPGLKKIDCYGNDLQELDLSALSELEHLVAGMNSFKTLDVSNNLNLKYLDLYDSPGLEILYVARGQRISELYVENSVQIKYKE